MDTLSLHTPVSGEFACAILHISGGNLQIHLEGSLDNPTIIKTATWDQIAVKSDANLGASLMVFDELGNQVGITQNYTYKTTPAYVDYVYFGDGNGSTLTTGRLVYFDKVKMCYLGACPWPIKE